MQHEPDYLRSKLLSNGFRCISANHEPRMFFSPGFIKHARARVVNLMTVAHYNQTDTAAEFHRSEASLPGKKKKAPRSKSRDI